MDNKELQERRDMGLIDYVEIPKINNERYITITNKYYIGESRDIFKGIELYDIKIIILCLSIVDITLSKYNAKDSGYSLKEISGVHIKPDDIGKLMGTNYSKRSIVKSLNKLVKLTEQSKSISGFGTDLFFIDGVNDEIYMFFKMDIINWDCGSREYTKLFLGDILETKTIVSMVLKLKVNKYVDRLSFKGGVQIKSTLFELFVSKNINPKRYLEKAYESINKENENLNLKLSLNYEKKSGIISVTGEPTAWYKNIELNCDKYKCCDHEESDIRIGCIKQNNV